MQIYKIKTLNNFKIIKIFKKLIQIKKINKI